MKTRPSILSALGGAVLAAGTPAPASGGIEYELAIIEPWNTEYSLAVSGAIGLNNLNQVSGSGTAFPAGTSTDFLWTLESGRQPIDLSGQINDNGVIATDWFIRWPDGMIETLPSPLVGVSELNNNNVIAGSAGSIFICYPSGENQAIVWDPATDPVLVEVQFGIPDADEAWGLNIHNQIVGIRAENGLCGTHKAFYLDLETGVHIDLHLLLNGSPSGLSRAFDINDDGIVIGEGSHEGDHRPFLWHPDQGFTFLPAAPGALLMDTHFESINNLGQAVGAAIVNDQEWHAIIWDEARGVRDLNDFVELPADFVVDGATRINENGWIIGSGHYGAWSPSRAVVLMPIAPPDPADLDGDGIVGVLDLLSLLGGWGPCAEEACPADLDGDGTTGVLDLLVLLAQWG